MESSNATKYQPVIGIETHVQLNTKTKLFSTVANDATQAPPNTLISYIDTGFPGALPVLNRAAIELCAKAAFALNTEPQKFSRFERKHYFYPDLPKGYQITQLASPIIKGGLVEIETDGQAKKINIERANLEEDAGKNTHPAGADYSLVDLNRAGTPLLEIVSAPEISSAAEAKSYARELWLLMRYAGITDGDLYHGHIRFDVNVSLSQNGQMGTRSEIKNLNSFRSVENAVSYEITRQTELLDRGEKIVQETRGWDDAKQKSFNQRGKEEAEDYRYMPEPDIPPLDLEEKFLSSLQSEMPESLTKIRNKLADSQLDKAVIEDILDSTTVYARIAEAMTHQASPENLRRLAFDALETPESHQINVRDHLEIAELQRGGSVSSSAAKQLIKAKAKNKDKAVHELASELDLHQVSDESELEKIVSEVLTQNSQAAEDVKNGQDKAIGFLVGQVMAKSKGRANPQIAQQLIKKQLGI